MSKSRSRATTRRAVSAAKRPAASASLVYVYAAVAGQPSARVVARLGPLPDGGPPRLLGIDSQLSVVIADVPADMYDRGAIEQRPSDLDWVGACGGAHHAVSDALFETHLVVPLRLFTLFASETRAKAAPVQSLLDLVDSLLDKGVVLDGEIVLGLADVDLIYVRLSVLLAAADRVLPERS